MGKIQIALLALFCCITFYLFGDEEGVSLQYLPNVPVIQSIVTTMDLKDLGIDGETDSIFTESYSRKIKILGGSPVTQLPVEMEITLLDYHKSQDNPLQYPNFRREDVAKFFNIPVRVRYDETVEILENSENLSEDLCYLLYECFFSDLYEDFDLLPFFSALADEQLVPGQVLTKKLKKSEPPVVITVTEITQDKIYVDIEPGISASFMRDNAMIHDISCVIVVELLDYLTGSIPMTLSISSKKL